MQRKASHATVRHTSIRRNVLRARVVGCDASCRHVPIKYEEAAAGETEDQCVCYWQEHRTVNILKVEPAKRELLRSPGGASCVVAGGSRWPDWECLALMLLLPP